MPEASATPLISVVMPVYNGARFIRPTLESILAQTLGDFECIISDDGSTDGTKEILAEYAAKDPRFKIHLLQHAGKVTAFNNGFHHARGEFIAIHCADDISLPERFAVEIEYLRNHPHVAAVGAWVNLIDAEGQVTGTLRHVTDPFMVDWRLLFRNPVADSSAMFRKSVMEEFGWYRETASEDYELLGRISRKYDIANIPRILGQYRIWQGNFTSLHGAEEEETVYMVIQEKASALLGGPVSAEDARALRLPMTGRRDMPRADIDRAAALLRKIVPAFLASRPLTRTQKQLVLNDASEYLFRLADIAGTQSRLSYVQIRLQAIFQNPLFVLHILRQLVRL